MDVVLLLLKGVALVIGVAFFCAAIRRAFFDD